MRRWRAGCLATCALPIALLLMGSCQISASENAQMGILGPLGNGGSCGYGFENATQRTSGAYQGAISSNSSLLVDLPTMGCGACIEVQCNLVGNQGACIPDADPLILVIADSCPSCNLNAPLPGFSEIADTYLGSVNVHARQVPCPATGSIIAKVIEYRESGGGYLKLVILNAASSGALESIEISATGSDNWKKLTSQFGATWEGSILPPFPLDMRLTNSYGQTITIERALPTDLEGDIDLGDNFPLAAGPSLPPAETAGTTAEGGDALRPTSAEEAAQAPQVVGPPDPANDLLPANPVGRDHLDGSALDLVHPKATHLEGPVLKRRSRSLKQLVYYPNQGSFSLVDLVNSITSSGGITLAGLPPPPVPPPPAAPVVAALPPTPDVASPLPPASTPAAAATETPAAVATETPAAAATETPAPAAEELELSSVPASGEPCKQVNDFLSDSPSLQTWYKLLEGSGYTNSLAQPNVSVTMFAPINSAFTDPILEGTLVGSSRNIQDISELAATDPASVNPLIGYHILYDVTRSSQLTPGVSLNTTDTIKTFGADDRTLAITVASATEITGIGSSANILRSDIELCGPTILYIIDGVLLPFSPDSASSPVGTVG